jgi:erythronate-4-phosphate dehydrogenase
MGSLLITMARRFGFECRQKTLGIVGVGNVGSKVARLAALLGFRVLLCDPPRARREGGSGFVDLDRIISESDIISCHVPLTTQGEDATYHLIDSNVLSRMNSSQILINTSRGEVVDCQALRQALEKGALKAASLDVWENEPDIDSRLLELLFSGTPHIAGYSADGKAAGTMMCVQALGRFFDLPCKEWEVQDMPFPSQTLEFTIDTKDRKPQDVLADAILHTYNVMDDDAALRKDILSFEKQRSEYPVRREFPAFAVTPLNDDTGRATVFLREAGFYISE